MWIAPVYAILMISVFVLIKIFPAKESNADSYDGDSEEIKREIDDFKAYINQLNEVGGLFFIAAALSIITTDFPRDFGYMYATTLGIYFVHKQSQMRSAYFTEPILFRRRRTGESKQAFKVRKKVENLKRLATLQWHYGSDLNFIKKSWLFWFGVVLLLLGMLLVTPDEAKKFREFSVWDIKQSTLKTGQH